MNKSEPDNEASLKNAGPQSSAGVSSKASETPALAYESTTFTRDGVVYRETPDGYILEDAAECTTRTYRVIDGTVAIGRLAFAGNANLEMIALPEGVQRIEDSAFSAAENLVHVMLPKTIESIEDWAFFGSCIESIHIPAKCTHIGTCALVADGGGRSEMWTGGRSLNLCEVSIDPENPVFYLESDVLCARNAAHDGGDTALLYIGPSSNVVLPETITEIAPMAFANVSTLDELVIPGNVRRLGASALAFSEPPRRIAIRLDPAIEGHSILDLHPPRNEAGLNAVVRMFRTERIEPARIMNEMDHALLNQNNHYLRYRLMLERLADPLLLSDAMRERFISFLRDKIWMVCQIFRERSYMEGLTKLVSTNVLDSETLTKVTDRAAEESDTALVAQLLQLRQNQVDEADPFAL